MSISGRHGATSVVQVWPDVTSLKSKSDFLWFSLSRCHSQMLKTASVYSSAAENSPPLQVGLRALSCVHFSKTVSLFTNRSCWMQLQLRICLIKTIPENWNSSADRWNNNYFHIIRNRHEWKSQLLENSSCTCCVTRVVQLDLLGVFMNRWNQKPFNSLEISGVQECATSTYYVNSCCCYLPTSWSFKDISAVFRGFHLHIILIITE